MMRLFLACVAALTFAVTSVAQDDLASIFRLDPVIAAKHIDAYTVLAHHQSGAMTALYIDETGTVLWSYGDPVEGVQDPSPVPVFESSYVDQDGVTRRVVTPATGNTDAQLEKAFKLHQRMMRLMQAAHPPRPV